MWSATIRMIAASAPFAMACVLESAESANWVSRYRVEHHEAKLIPGIALRSDALTDPDRDVSSVGLLRHIEDQFAHAGRIAQPMLQIT